MSDHRKNYDEGYTTGMADHSKPGSVLGAMQRKAQDEYQKKIDDRIRSSWNRTDAVSTPSISPLVLFFGLIGVLFGAGYNISQGGSGLIGGFFGFIAGGFLSGVLSKFKLGRIILWIIGGSFVAMLIFQIFFRA